MSESFTVSSRRELKTNAPQILREIASGFETVARLAKDTQESLAGFSANFRALSRAGSGINKLVDQMERLDRMKLGEGVSNQIGTIARQTRAMADAADSAASSFRQISAATRTMRALPGSGGGGSRSRGGHGMPGAADIAMAGSVVGDAGVGLLGNAFKAAFAVDAQQSVLNQNITIPLDQIAAVRKQAEEMTRTIGGSTILENMKTIAEAFTVTGNLAEAIAGAPAMARMNLVLQSLPGAHAGDPGFAAMQSTELLQRFYSNGHVDLNAMNQQMAAMTKVSVGTGGRVDPSQYLAFAKQSRMAGMLASDDFLYSALPAIMIALGGSRTGTAMMAGFREFSIGTMKKEGLAELKKYGLADKSARYSGGQVMDPAKHITGYSEFITNPFNWVQDVLFKQLRARGIDTNDRMQLGMAMAHIARTQTGLGWLGELTLGYEGIAKEKAKIGQTSTDPLAVAMQYNPMMQVRQFEAAENEMLVSLGELLKGPGLEALRGLTSVLHDMADWAKANPGLAKTLAEGVAGVTAFAVASSILANAVVIGGPLVMGIRALAAAGAIPALGAAFIPFAEGGLAIAGVYGLAKALGLLSDEAQKESAKIRGLDGSESPRLSPSTDPQASEPGRYSFPRWAAPGGAPASHSSFTRPPGGAASAPIVLHANLHVDGKKMAATTIAYIVNSMDRPPSGSANDPTMSPWGAYHGGMIA